MAKYTVNEGDNFTPVTLSITFETADELKAYLKLTGSNDTMARIVAQAGVNFGHNFTMDKAHKIIGEIFSHEQWADLSKHLSEK